MADSNRQWTIKLAGIIFTIIFTIIGFTISSIKSNAEDIVITNKESIARDNGIKADISSIKVDVGELKKDVEYMRESQERIELQQMTFSNKMDKLIELTLMND